MYVVDPVWSCATRPGNIILTVWDCESTNRHCRVRMVVYLTCPNIEHRVHQAAFLTSVAQHSMCTRYYDRQQRDSNPRPFDHEPGTLTNRPQIRQILYVVCSHCTFVCFLYNIIVYKPGERGAQWERGTVKAGYSESGVQWNKFSSWLITCIWKTLFLVVNHGAHFKIIQKLKLWFSIIAF